MGQQSSGAAPPDYAKLMELGYQLAEKYGKREAGKEFEARAKWDPRYVYQQQQLQSKFGPIMYRQQLNALNQLAPGFTGAYGQLGQRAQEIMQRGYVDPQQNAMYRAMMANAGKIDPRQEAAYGALAAHTLADLQRGGINPNQMAGYAALGRGTRGDYLRGSLVDPETMRQIQQSALGGAGGNIYGAGIKSALQTGTRGMQLRQARTGALQNFLGLEAPQAAAIRNAQFMSQLQSPQAQQFGQQMAAYGQSSPMLGALGVGGTFLGTQSPVSMVSGIPGVQVGATHRYINPYGGQEAAQFGLQNYQNQLAGGGGGGGSNPWMNALQGAGTGASMGSSFGPYGAAGGAIVGGIGGAFGQTWMSDARLKENIVRVGASPSGIPIYEFTFKDDKAHRRFRGTIAQELLKTRWDAVYQHKGKLLVDYDKLDIKMEEVKQNAMATT